MSESVPKELANELTALQRRIVDTKSKVLLVLEGRSGRVIGRVANEFMNLLEPRGTIYTHFNPQESLVSPHHIMSYITREPASGTISIYDRSWYASLMVAHLKGIDDDDALRNSLAYERYMTYNDVVLVKVFLDIKEEDLEDVGSLFGSKREKNSTFLTDDHIGQKGFDRKFFKSVMEKTSTENAPWDVIDAVTIEDTVEQLVRAFIDRVDHRMSTPYEHPDLKVEPLFPNPRENADLSLKASKYKSELAELSSKLNSLQNRLAASDRSLILVFEGWDAAGKGGSIKRVARALNPRGYYAVPVAAPVGDEKVHTYLWRFAKHMPKNGHIVIFDRSWYGRMMVEPIEGFCTQGDYNRSASEIRGFERTANTAGGIIIKFWMEVSPEEQLRRFQGRQDNPLKNWKITDEDWRNREKWDVYEDYIDRMISATNMPSAPWVVVESEDKKYARLKVLRTIVETLERELD